MGKHSGVRILRNTTLASPFALSYIHNYGRLEAQGFFGLIHTLEARPEAIKLFFMLIIPLVEHEILIAGKYKSIKKFSLFRLR